MKSQGGLKTMKNMNLKRIVTVILSASMVLGSTVMAMADSATLSGNATYEGHLDKKVFSITLPTAASDAFDFKFDPESLISETNGARYSGETFETGKTVYFKNETDPENVKWTDTSTTVSAASASSVSVDLVATVTVTSANGITFVSQNSVLESDTNPNLYLAFVDAADTGKPAVVQADGTVFKAEYSKTIDAVAANKFTTSWNGVKYVYQANTEDGTLADSDKKKISMYMTGAANTTADWSGITAQPQIEVVWAMTEHSDAISLEGVYDSANKKFKITFPNGVTCTDTSLISDTRVNGIAFETAIGASADGTKISFGKDEIKAACGGSTPATCIFTFTYNGVNYTSTISVS